MYAIARVLYDKEALNDVFHKYQRTLIFKLLQPSAI